MRGAEWVHGVGRERREGGKAPTGAEGREVRAGTAWWWWQTAAWRWQERARCGCGDRDGVAGQRVRWWWQKVSVGGGRENVSNGGDGEQDDCK